MGSEVGVGRREVEARAGRTAVEIFGVNERMWQMILEHLEPGAWRAKPAGKVRTIAAIVTHVHHVRCKWVRLTAPQVGVPARLDRARCSVEEARLGLAESAERCGAMLAGGV
jgi:uncharacterized damage-inducible protein DinB